MSSLAHPTPTLEVSCRTYYHPPSRLHVLGYIPQYHIQAFPASRPQNTVVYISTKSPAIVNYTLGPSWREQLGGRTVLDYNGTNSDWGEEDEEKLSMRIIRAGGAVLDTTYPHHDMQYIQRTEQFAAFSRTKEYIFGWPDDGGLWVLDLHGLVPWEYWEPTWNWRDGDEFSAELFELMDKEAELGYVPLPDGAFDTKRLDQADSMSQYCTELSKLNATFYQDQTTSEEALEAGLFDKNTLTTHWPGMASWITDRNERSARSAKAKLESMPIYVPTRSECVIAWLGDVTQALTRTLYMFIGR
jgi:hypothetical protein